MAKYEYKVYECLKGYVQDYDLNEYGNDGWELVSTAPANDKDYTLFIFKREIE